MAWTPFPPSSSPPFSGRFDANGLVNESLSQKRANPPVLGEECAVWKSPLVEGLGGWKIPSLPNRLPLTESV